MCIILILSQLEYGFFIRFTFHFFFSSAPTGRTIPNMCSDARDGNWKVEYTPTEVGPYTMDIRYCDLPIPNSPHSAKAYDASAIIVGNMPTGIVGSPVEFNGEYRKTPRGFYSYPKWLPMFCENLFLKLTTDFNDLENWVLAFIGKLVL